LQPEPQEKPQHDSMSSVDSSTCAVPLEAMHTRSLMASTPPNAQQLPQVAWSLMWPIILHSGHAVRASKATGTLTSSYSSAGRKSGFVSLVSGRAPMSVLTWSQGGLECIALPSLPSTNPHAALHQLSPRRSSRTSPSVKPLNLAFSPAVQVQATSLTSWTVCWCASFSPARHHDSAPTRRLKRTAMQGAREGNCRRGAGGRCERQSAQGVRRCGGRAGAPCAARGGQRAPLRETLAQTAA